MPNFIANTVKIHLLHCLEHMRPNLELMVLYIIKN